MGYLLGIATVVVVLVAEEKGGVIVVGGENVGASLFEGKEAVGDIGAEGACAGGGFAAGRVENRIGW